MAPTEALGYGFRLQPKRLFDGDLLSVQQHIVRPEKFCAIQNCTLQAAETAFTFIFLIDNPFFGDGSFVPVATDVGLIFDLEAGTVNLKGSSDFEFNRYVNFENVNGSEKADTILGSKVANLLDGYLGNDEITGRGGRDILTGGAGNDDFNFVKPGDSPVGKGRDVITDFAHTLDDIDLSKLHPNTDTDKFTFVGQNKLKHVGDLHFVLHNGAGTAHDFTLVEANLKGDATPEIQIELTGLVHLDKGDFML